MLLCSLRGGVWQAIPKFLSFRESFCLNSSDVFLQKLLPLYTPEPSPISLTGMHKYEMQFGKSLSFVICLSNCLIYVCVNIIYVVVLSKIILPHSKLS